MYMAIFGVAVLCAVVWGYRHGFFRVGMRLWVVAACYGLAWQETPALADFLANKHWVNGVMVWPVASAVLFFVGALVFGYLANALANMAPEEWTDSRSVAGAMLGLVLGCFLGVVAVWTLGILKDAQAVKAGHSPVVGNALPLASGDTLAEFDEKVRAYSARAVAQTGRVLLGNSQAAPLIGQLLQAPLSVGESLKYLAAKPQVAQLFQEPRNYAVLTRGTVDEIMRLPAFRELQADAHLMDILAAAGLQGAGGPTKEQSRLLAEKLQTLARNIEKIRETEDFKSVSTDSNIVQQWQQGNFLLLLGNEKIRHLVQQLFDAPTSEDAPALSGAVTQAKDSAKKFMAESGGKLSSLASGKSDEKIDLQSVKAYRWQDASGGWHYTEDKPPVGTAYKEVFHEQ